MALRVDIESFLNTLLTPERFKDYRPNGLRPEGVAEPFGLGHAFIEIANPA